MLTRRVFCKYQGKESFNSIIDSLDADGYGNRETFESFSRVSIRRLGRLLPDACWVSRMNLQHYILFFRFCCKYSAVIRVVCLRFTQHGSELIGFSLQFYQITVVVTYHDTLLGCFN